MNNEVNYPRYEERFPVLDPSSSSQMTNEAQGNGETFESKSKQRSSSNQGKKSRSRSKKKDMDEKNLKA